MYPILIKVFLTLFLFYTGKSIILKQIRLDKMYHLQNEKMKEVSNIMNRINHNVMTSPTPESYNNPSISPVSVPWVPGAPTQPDSSGNETEN